MCPDCGTHLTGQKCGNAFCPVDWVHIFRSNRELPTKPAPRDQMMLNVIAMGAVFGIALMVILLVWIL